VALLDEPRSEGEVFDVGSCDEVSIEELARSIIARTDSASRVVHVPVEVV
jgi:hypothetical protein